MCLIANISDPVNGVLSMEHAKNAINRNSDGIGCMYVDEGRVRVARKLGTDEEQLRLYKQFTKINKPFAVHFRFSTHGAKDILNCHPFQILDYKNHGRDLYLMHNGVISSIDMNSKGMSDTYNYCEHYLKPLLAVNPELLYNEAFRKIVEGHIGTGSKLLFMDSANGTVEIYNKRMGTDKPNGLWLSNTYSIEAPYVAPKRTTPYNYYNNYNYRDSDSCAVPAKAVEVKTIVKTISKKKEIDLDKAVDVIYSTMLKMSEKELYTLIFNEPEVVAEVFSNYTKRGEKKEKISA